MVEVILYILAGLGLAVVALLALGMARLLAFRRRLRSRLARLGLADTESAALFGLASDRREQRPGPGALGLREDAVAFAQLAPARDLVIARRDITSVTTDWQFMGRRAQRELLVITWAAEGEGDAVAFVTEDPESWRERLADPGGAR